MSGSLAQDRIPAAGAAAAENLDAAAAERLSAQLGLLPAELEHIEAGLGRLPRRTELAVFAGMYSEHCSYKSTRHLLATLPKQGAHVLAGPGAHAGVVDVGHGFAVAFKVESHNHPSAVEPYQGAATGVGGILRDIIAQGARPCAVLDGLCLGLPDTPQQKHLRRGVVAGIGGYGNAIGVANVGGKTVFDRRYAHNPLVNAMAAGLLEHGGTAAPLRHACASGVGNVVLYVGAATGRDGVLGAAFASEELGEDRRSQRSHVQVGDPFAGKKLLEAALAFGPTQGLVAGQDMGACGITCASMEMAAAGKVGLDIDLSCVPLREPGMSPQEILLSESQERFLFVVEAAQQDAAVAHFRSYGVQASICGQVVPGTHVRVRHHQTCYVDLPADLVTGGSLALRWPEAAPAPPAEPPVLPPQDCAATLLALLRQPGIGSLQPLVERYDQSVGARTVRGPGAASAAVLRLPRGRGGFALSLTGRGEACAVHPYLGAQAAVAAGLRDLAGVGARAGDNRWAQHALAAPAAANVGHGPSGGGLARCAFGVGAAGDRRQRVAVQ